MYNECHLLTNTEYLQGQIVPITALLKWLYNLTWYCLDNYLNLVQLFPFFSLSCSCRYVECFRRAPLTTADLRIAIHSELLWDEIMEILAHTKRACRLEWGGQKSCIGRGKKEVTELCLCTAACAESRHQQDIQVSQQCCPGTGVCSLKKRNRNCWLAHCLEFQWEKKLLPEVCFLLCSEEQHLLYIEDCIKNAGIHHCFLTLADTSCFALIFDLIRRNQTNAYGIINNLKLFLLMGKGLATNIWEIIEGEPDLLVTCFATACKAFGWNAHICWFWLGQS